MLDCHRRVAIHAALLGGGLYLTYQTEEWLRSFYYRWKYTRLRKAKIASLAEAKRNFAAYLAQRPMSQEDIDRITSMPFLKLVEMLKNEELPRAFVLLAFQHKTFQVDQKLNCVVEFLYPDWNDVNVRGPLAGVPISLKECLSLKGFDNCCGCVYFLNDPKPVDAAMVTAIKSLGGVPFVRTTVPQTMMSTYCSNPIDGFTRNPLNPERSPHGSSGGEAALIGGGGSVLGFGTDIGGSVRIPAAMCGIVGFKPTTGRLSYKNVSRLAQGKLIKPTVGSLSRDVDTCALIVKNLFDSVFIHSLDHTIPPLPYAEVEEGRRLRIGYFVHLGKISPVPAVWRAIMHVRKQLTVRGHEVIEWKLPFDGGESLELYLRAVCGDGGKDLKKYLQYDTLDPCLRGFYRLSNMSPWLRWLMGMWLRLRGEWETAVVYDSASGFSNIQALQNHSKLLMSFQQKVFESLSSADIDVVLCPAVGFAAAMQHFPSRPTTGMLAFSNLANVLNSPAGVLPSGCRVEPADIEKLEALANRRPIESKDPNEKAFYANYSRLSPLHRHMFDLQKNTEGLPIPVQLMGLPWRDELVIYAMREVEAAIQS